MAVTHVTDLTKSSKYFLVFNTVEMIQFGLQTALNQEEKKIIQAYVIVFVPLLTCIMFHVKQTVPREEDRRGPK